MISAIDPAVVDSVESPSMSNVDGGEQMAQPAILQRRKAKNVDAEYANSRAHNAATGVDADQHDLLWPFGPAGSNDHRGTMSPTTPIRNYRSNGRSATGAPNEPGPVPPSFGLAATRHHFTATGPNVRGCRS